jgi:hypothetical protein
VKLELAAVESAIRKGLLYLSGLPNFTLMVDHQALVEWGNFTSHYSTETVVIAAKKLVINLAPSGDLLSEALLTGFLQFRNTQTDSGLYPAQIVFGHQLRSIIPAHRFSYVGQWNAAIAEQVRNTQYLDTRQQKLSTQAETPQNNTSIRKPPVITSIEFFTFPPFHV